MRALPAAVLAHALTSALAPVLAGAFALDPTGAAEVGSGAPLSPPDGRPLRLGHGRR